MPNVMAALRNIGGALCSTPQSLADENWSAVQKCCQDAKPVEICRGAQTNETISAASGPKFTILWRHVEEILLLNKFFSDCRYVPSCEDIARQTCAMAHRWRLCGDFLGAVFSASPVQHVSDLHSKFALRPHHVSKYGRHPICDG